MQDLKNPTVVRQLFKGLKSDVDLQKMQVVFDWNMHTIALQSEETNSDGQPLFHWERNLLTGTTVEETREALPTFDYKITAPSASTLNRQRQLAYNVVYLFIGMTSLTLILIYIFYKLDEQEAKAENMDGGKVEKFTESDLQSIRSTAVDEQLYMF